MRRDLSLVIHRRNLLLEGTFEHLFLARGTTGWQKHSVYRRACGHNWRVPCIRVFIAIPGSKSVGLAFARPAKRMPLCGTYLA